MNKCGFSAMNKHYKKLSKERKTRSKWEEQKEENDKIMEELGFCIIDGHREKIGNFR